jgi:competence protein ComEC
MDRPIISGGACYLTGVVLGEAWTYFPISVIGLLLVGGVLLYRSGLRPKSPWVYWALLVIVFVGLVRVQFEARPKGSSDLARWVTGSTVRLVGSIDAPLRHGPDRTVIMLRVRSIRFQDQSFPVSGRVRIVVRNFITDLNYGDQISALVRLRPVWGLLNPGGFDYAALLQREGIGAVASVRHPEALVRLTTGGFGPLRQIYAWRERIRQMLDNSLTPASSEILQAMLIGETGFLTPDIRESFMASGTTHILSISGSHLALVALVVFKLSVRVLRWFPADWLLLMSRRLTVTRLAVLVTIAPVTFYTILAGGQIATVRSLVMIYVYLGAVWFQRAGDAMNALAVAALLVALCEPRAIFSISFQLSFIAVLAMVLIGEKRSLLARDDKDGARIPEGKESQVLKLWNKFRMYWGMTAAAGISTMPLVAHYFNQIGWVGFLSNLIIVPWVGMVIVPLGLACSVGAILFETTNLPLAGLNDALVRGLYGVVRWFSHFPGAVIHVPAPPVSVLVAIYLGTALFVVIRHRGILKWGTAGLCSLIVLVWIARLWLSHPDGRLHVTFLDVGQGDAAWLEMPNGRTMLIDGGGAYGTFDMGRLVIAPYLWNTGHWKIDCMVASHPQLDHMGGLSYIAKQFKIGEIWTNGVEKETEFYHRFQEVVKAKGIPEKVVTRGFEPVRWGKVRIQPLHPAPSDSTLSDNDRSIVLRIDYGGESILFTGDIERPGERLLLGLGRRLRATILKVPHHGSRSSIDSEFLSKVNPVMAVISVGRNNPYGHPSPETIDAYRTLDAKIYRTDRNGAVVLETNGTRRTVRTRMDWAFHPVHWGRGMTGAEAANLGRILRQYWLGSA